MKLRAFATWEIDVDTIKEAAAWEDLVAKTLKDAEQNLGVAKWDIKERRDRAFSEDKMPRYRRMDA